MPVELDDLDMLLFAVRKTINDNQHFLQSLVDETVDADSDVENIDEKGEEDGEEFEEL